MSFAITKLPGLDSGKLVALVEPILRAHGVVGVELIWRPDRKGQVLEVTVERQEARAPGAGVTIDVCSEISRDLSSALDVSDVISSAHYRLEVGSPGLDRPLYGAPDFRRFAGQLVKIKLKAPLTDEGFLGQKVVRGTLFGLETEVLRPADSAADSVLAEKTDSAADLAPSAPVNPGAVADDALAEGVAEGGVTAPSGEALGRTEMSDAPRVTDWVVVETERGNIKFALSQVESARLVFEWQGQQKANSGRGPRPFGGKNPRPKRSK